MRIIVILNSLYTGGAEFSTLAFYGWLLKRGDTIKIVCIKKATPSYDPRQFGFDEVHYLAGENVRKRVQALRALVKEFKPQLVHSVLFDANLITRFVRMKQRNFVHLESLVNETYSSFRLADPHVTRIKLEGYRLLDAFTQRWGVDHFHANGISVAQHYHDKLGIARHRITVIPRGRDRNPFAGDSTHRERVRQEVQAQDRLVLINVARLEYQKGQDVLIEALGRLGEEKNNIQVLLVGREGKMSPGIKEKIQRYQLQETVFLLGHRNDVASLLAAADVFIFPSRFEGLPGALIEAEAAGLPIICSDIPNNREVAEENRNALFFKVDDVDSLIQALLKVIHDSTARANMRTESLAIYQHKFSLEEVHERMLALIKKITTAS